MKNPIIVALDLPEPEAALRLAQKLAPVVGAFKIGSELFTSGGPEMVAKIRGMGGSVFLDLKFHDIPNTVAKAVAAAVRLDVQMLTLHTVGGLEMMQAAAQSAQETAARLHRPVPLIFGVTVLTSMNDANLAEVGIGATAGNQVERMAELAIKAGLGGLVCSPLEIKQLRTKIPATMQLVTPGIRTGADKADDQKRTLGPREALEAGASWLVIGRPIYAAADPFVAASTILADLL